MTDKKLESFKIGDAQRAPAAQPQGKGAADPAQGQSVGFERIESLLDQEDPVEIGNNLSQIIESLNALASNAKTNRDKVAANKAVMAVERAVDLLDYLYQTKLEMEQSP